MSNVSVINKEDIPKHESRWGNDYLEVSCRDLAELILGKVLYYNNGEYCTFITVVEDEDGN